MQFVEFKKAINFLLESKYKTTEGYRYYGKEVKEGYVAPCFFTELLDKGSKKESINFDKGGITVKITYFQKIKNELDQLQKVDEIKELFSDKLTVGNRKLTVGEITHDYAGEYSDILQISVDFDFKENKRKEEAEEVATGIQTDITEG